VAQRRVGGILETQSESRVEASAGFYTASSCTPLEIPSYEASDRPRPDPCA
jgi:hypothetical protein